HVDRVLRLVVGRAAAVIALALLRDLPRHQALAPLVLEPADHVAMAVGQHGLEARILDAGSHQERPAMSDWIVEDPDAIAERRQGRGDLVREIGREMRPALRHLALGTEADAAVEIAEEGAVIPAARGALDRLLPSHRAWT